MYKYTSIYKIDVRKIKRNPKQNSSTREQLKKINKEKYFNIVYGYLTKDVLEKLLNKYTANQICILFNITRAALKYKATR